jgi:hypothetical protein
MNIVITRVDDNATFVIYPSADGFWTVRTPWGQLFGPYADADEAAEATSNMEDDTSHIDMADEYYSRRLGY